MSSPEISPPKDEMADELAFNMAEPTNRVSLQRRSSLFGLSSGASSLAASPPRKTYKSDYGEELTTEAQQWHRLVKNLVRHNASLENHEMKVTVADQNIEQRVYIQAAPDFEKFQSDAVAFAKLAQFFAVRLDDIRERREALRDRIDSELNDSAYNLAIKCNRIRPRFMPSD